MITRQGTTFFGLSTDDPKPSNANNGSCFIEMDTGAIYFYAQGDYDSVQFDIIY